MSENIEPLNIDKSPWGDGPWQTEPDRVDFVSSGFACLMLRHPRAGSWCCYVGVPPEHPAYGAQACDVNVECHSGLNYADTCSGAICHVPEPGMPDDVWWLGTDFEHVWDFAPGRAAMEIAMDEAAGRPRIEYPDFMRPVYRDLQYVREQAEFLARQLREMAAA
jgi:hypothetical protein